MTEQAKCAPAFAIQACVRLNGARNAGPVSDVEVVRERDGSHRGFAFVTFQASALCVMLVASLPALWFSLSCEEVFTWIMDRLVIVIRKVDRHGSLYR